jgi:4-amino-4-deoxy-L-arabinose transferase-like glycosyltransferase
VVFAVVAFFSFSKTILPGYVGPAIPFISILVGGYLSAKIKEGRRMYGFFGVALLLALAFVIAAFVAGQRVGALAFLSDTWWFLLILPMGVLLSVYFSARGMIQRALLLLSISWASLSMLFFGVWYPTLDQQNPVVDSQSIRDLHADRVVVGYRAFNPAFVFNYRQPIPVLNSPGELQSFASAHPNILIVSQSRYLDELAGYRKIYHKQDLFERTETVVLIN